MIKRKLDTIYVDISDGFTVSTPRHNLSGEKFRWQPAGLYIILGHNVAEIHYAGDRAGESGIVFEIPSLPAFLREFARKMEEKADELESKE